MYPVYRGIPRQSGNGLGGLFKSALRTIIPIVKPLVKPLVKSGLSTLKRQGLGAAHDIIIGGQKPKDVIKRRGKQVLKDIGDETFAQLGHINVTPSRKRRHSPRRRSRGNTSKRNRLRSRPLDIFD